MERWKVFEDYFELPGGHQIQLMVMQSSPEGCTDEEYGHCAFRSRIWIGHESQTDPMLYRSQDHSEMRTAVDACYSMMIRSAPEIIGDPGTLASIQLLAHEHFSGATQAI